MPIYRGFFFDFFFIFFFVSRSLFGRSHPVVMRYCSLCLHKKHAAEHTNKLSYAYVIAHNCKSPASVLKEANESNTMVPAFSQYCDKCEKITYIAPDEPLQMTLVRWASEKNDRVGLWALKNQIIKNNSTSCT